MSRLQDEIKQARPFATLEQEVLLNIARTADMITQQLEAALKPAGLSPTQYNVLRILRGANPQGLTCSAIGERMIAADPDITRLLARLKKMGLIRQQRDKRDRRILWTTIAPAGLHLLAQLDPLIQDLPGEHLGHMKPAELDELIRLLELARKHCGDTQTPISCEGDTGSVSCETAAEART